ncbi:MAG TPA: sigma-70 family RNA polymerase sigma factor [Anaerolineales bacterium]|nr:sigma-70 family RNA polymerase sigma factor [Anaerolineales bacterium]HND47321.1 sigma-70 family RNA polymerase sigma factor [Anaerolineales bacterium]HNE05767.1 sigma-70 family RNA polymerase sigma factor [Anaerolineales bacterium]HNF95452.1 sigma-70 family RNA polymerase sigma factor [Anaerolineales bacterium]HNH26672.1 sigma-70 family RNA polymerase sigma factor [Anaerolineales bacterium]
MNEEQTWVLQAQQGNDEAFTKLVETYQTPVFNLCYRMLGEPELAEDAAQETFLRAYQHLHRYDQKRPFPTWLLSIAAHYCIDRLRRRKFSMFSMDTEDEEGNSFEIPDVDAPNPEGEAITGQTNERVHAMLKDLDATDRAAIIMRYWYDYSEKEIAESLNLTVSAVKSRLHRARKELAGLWAEQEDDLLAEMERRHHESPAF